jgi:hypothetical protein
MPKSHPEIDLGQDHEPRRFDIPNRELSYMQHRRDGIYWVSMYMSHSFWKDGRSLLCVGNLLNRII